MEEWAPAKWAIEGDNVGLHVGDRARPVSRVLTTLDLSEMVLREAVQGRFDFVVAHHPLISRHVPTINSITTDDVLGKKIMTLISNGIGFFCAHTNLDMAEGGVNDLLFDLLGLTNRELLSEPKMPDYPSLGAIGYLDQPMELAVYADYIGKALGSETVRYVGEKGQMIRKVGMCCGNGTSLTQYALAKKCDLFITGDIGYHLAMMAIENNMALIDATHYATEIPIARAIANYLKNAADQHGFDLTVQETRVNGQVFRST